MFKTILLSTLSIIVFNYMHSEAVYTDYKINKDLYCTVTWDIPYKIDKSKVVSYSPISINGFGTWNFTNGYSSNCYLEPIYKGEL